VGKSGEEWGRVSRDGEKGNPRNTQPLKKALKKALISP